MEDIYSREYVINLLKQVGVHEYKIIHSQTVANLAVNIGKQIIKEGHPVCMQVVELGSLLHDLGISKTLDDTSPNHASIGGDMARKYGFCESIARCIEGHEYVIWSKEEGKLFDMDMSRESFRPETWEERVVSFADSAVFVYSEAAREKEFWEDLHCLQKASIPYWKDVFQKYSLGDFDSKHPFIQRQYDHQKTMIKYVKPEFFKDKEYVKLAEKMRKAQIAYGLKVPFPYVEEL